MKPIRTTRLFDLIGPDRRPVLQWFSYRPSSRDVITFVLVFALIVAPVLIRTANADEPVTITVGGWIAITTAAAGVSWLVGKVLDAIFVEDPPKKKTTMSRQVEVELPDGRILPFTQTKTVDPPLTDLNPVATTSYPEDWVVSGPPIPGDLTVGSIQGRIDPGEQLVQDAFGLAVGSSVIDMVNAFGGVAGTDEWTHTETVDSYFRRPNNPNALDATFSFTPNGSLQLTTTDFPDTTATVGLSYAISTDLIDTTGTLPTLVNHASFQGGIAIDQGASTEDPIDGGIPVAIANVSSPGVLDVTFTGSPLLTFPVPNGYDFIQISADTVYTGAATLEPPLGDFNNDGLWNCDDINALSGAIASGSTDLSFDVNGDGVITAADITDAGTGWLAVGGANNPAATGGNAFLNGDANLDGTVDGQDFIIWNTNKFTVLPEWCGGDWNADGVIDAPDFLIWNENKFQSSGTQPVPEPGFTVLVWSLAGCLLWRRWRW